MTATTQQFLAHLGRGGTYQHLLVKKGKLVIAIPTPTGKDIALQNLEDGDIYFTVNPSDEQFTGKDKPTNGSIAALNCLYAEYDVKTTGEALEALLIRIETINPPPSVIIGSGGGFHAYWFLDKPFLLNTPEARKQAVALQGAWPTHVNGEQEVHDVSRVLRLPGTLNHKYAPPRPVVMVECDLDVTYELDYLEGLCEFEDQVIKVAFHQGRLTNTMTDAELVEKALAARNGQKFRALYVEGDTRGYPSNSEAEMALLRMLAFWTCGDQERMERIFNKSAIVDKAWEERPDHRAKEITEAIAVTETFYEGPEVVELDAEGKPIKDYLLHFGASDEGNGMCVAHRYDEAFCWNESAGWMYFDGTHWSRKGAAQKVDRAIVETLEARRNAAYERGKREGLTDKEVAKIKAVKSGTVQQSHRIRAIGFRLQNILYAHQGEFAPEPHLLNCKNGVVNLKTGEVEPHSPKQRFQYCITTEYVPGARSETWEHFLAQSIGNYGELKDWVQMAWGYTITGEMSEETFFYIFGPRRSGKGTTTGTLLALLGPKVSASVDFASFTSERDQDANNFDLAGLQQTRLIVASETSRYDRLSPKRIKTITGLGQVRCSYKHKDHFEYWPQFKIWLESNWPVNGDPDDDALWSRVRVVTYPTSFYGKEDKALKRRLLTTENRQGILAWMVEGAKAWYEKGSMGLPYPSIIRDDTDEHKKGLDVVQQFVDEYVTETEHPEDFVPNLVIFPQYVAFCKEMDQKNKGMIQFIRSLGSKGFDVGQRKDVTVAGEDGQPRKKQVKGVRGIKCRTFLPKIVPEDGVQT
jgi:putative DNA primase/helicase